MSNKSEIQTLNAKYESLVESLRGKAVGGGSGGSVETCTLTILNSGPPLPNTTALLGYTDETHTFQTITFTWGEVYKVIKGSLIYLKGANGPTTQPSDRLTNATYIVSATPGDRVIYDIYAITGNATITCTL